jgi:hypothetical protein
MKKLMATTVLAAIAIVSISSAQNMDSSRYPPGVLPNNWIAIGSSAGFVVTNGDFEGSDRSTGTLKGYFVLRRAGTWFRVDSSSHYGRRRGVLASHLCDTVIKRLLLEYPAKSCHCA